MSKFYSYLWLREDGTPYYAGKGCGKRAFVRDDHRIPPPRDRARILILNRDSEDEAFETEKELIFNWGRKDNGTGCLQKPNGRRRKSTKLVGKKALTCELYQKLHWTRTPEDWQSDFKS